MSGPSSAARSQSPSSHDASSRATGKASRSVLAEAARLVIAGEDPAALDPAIFIPLSSFLREERTLALAERPPNYVVAQRIDDVRSELALLTNETAYCTHKQSEVARLQQKLKHARESLQAAIADHQRALESYNEVVDTAVAALQAQHCAELAEHDERFAGELPVKYRHFSQEAQVMRAQEWALRETKQYTLAQAMMEEAQALEAFEMEQQKIQWMHDGRTMREAIVRKQEKQISCLREKLEMQWLAKRPDFVACEEHWKTVVSHLEGLTKKERVDRAEVKKETARILQREDPLPKLGRKVPPAPMVRVTTANNQRAYSNLAIRRARGRR